MPTFTYKAATAEGGLVSGVLDGDSEADVLRTLDEQALTVVALRPARTANRPAGSGGQLGWGGRLAGWGGRLARHSESRAEALGTTTTVRLRTVQLLEFTRQLKVMLASGVPLLETLGVLHGRARGDYQMMLARISTDIQRGATLSEALAQHPRTFDPLYVGTIRAGEAAGLQTEVLDQLTAYYERRAALRRELYGALTYPAIVVVTLIGACALLLTYVVPQFQSIFAAAKVNLPLPTQLLLATSRFMTAHGVHLLIGVVALALIAWWAAPHPRVRAAAGALAARLPVMGSILRLTTVVQFAQMLGLLERAGLPVLETLKVIETMLLPGPVRALTGHVRRQVAAGNSITAALEGTHVLPDLVEHMIAVGEQSGRIDETLLAAAQHYEEEMRVRLKRLTTALEPLLTLLVSGMVLFVAMAVFLPLWEANALMLKH